MSLQLSFAEHSAIGPPARRTRTLCAWSLRPRRWRQARVTCSPSPTASANAPMAVLRPVQPCRPWRWTTTPPRKPGASPRHWTVCYWRKNRWLQANGGGQPLLTTVSALVMRGRRFTLAHVGDCRVYRWHADTLQRVSEDHVWDQPGMQHVLKRALGLDQHLVLDFLDGELRLNESFVLLSDGIWAVLGDTAIAGILRDQPDLNSAAQTLVSAAHLAGSQDNASALLVRVDALGETSIGDALIHLQQWPLPPALKPGQTFEGWQVEGILGQSQQSLLYRVRDGQQQPWLLKTLPGALRDDHQAGQALLSEEWFLKRVAGRHFPEVHAASQRQHLYYVMREYSGSTLAELHERVATLPLAQWLDLAERLLRAIGILHRRQILHRDIKPENLLLGDDGELRLLDFGLAYCPGLSEDQACALPGTPSYIAPEAFRGDPPTPQQDLYAVGVTLYYLLTGHYPYGEIEAFQRPPVWCACQRQSLPARPAGMDCAKSGARGGGGSGSAF